MKGKWVFSLACFLFLFLAAGPGHAAFTPGTTYYLTIQKMNADGTVTDYSSGEVIADENGKLAFTLSSLPTNAEANFMVIIIKDEDGNVLRKGFVPAPPAGSTNLLGINSLSTAQTNAILAAGEAAGTDDPVAVAYLLVLLRSPEATVDDGVTLAALGKDAILSDSGFVGFLTANGVTAEQLAAFRSRLVYNAATGKKTIADLTASFKAAVDSGNVDTATQELQKAGGFMADVFMDAAEAAGIEFTLILAAHDAAGDIANNATNQARIATLSSPVRRSIEQSMSSFFRRIASVKVKSEYTRALEALSATGTQVTAYLAGVQTLMNANGNIDATYGEYYQNPDAYVSGHGTSYSAVQAAIEAAYQAAFTAFQNDITSSNADITAMKVKVAASFGIDASYLPADFGTFRDFTGTTKNWPIPQVVMMNWMADLIAAGGSFGYTRDTLEIPSTMTAWLGSCSDPDYWSQGECLAHSGTWTPGRRTYNTPSSAFNAYLGLQEDMCIIENARFAIYQEGDPTREEEKECKVTFQQRMDAAALRIAGTTDGTTVISDAMKNAVIKLLMQPSMD